MNKLDLIAVRNYVPEDKNFIMATWLRGLYHGNMWFNLIPRDIYFKHYNKVVEAILAKPTTTIKIACLKDDPEVILGYSVYENNNLHWVQTKAAWRNIGIAKSLIPTNITTITHVSKVGVTLSIRKNLLFNPFAL